MSLNLTVVVTLVGWIMLNHHHEESFLVRPIICPSGDYEKVFFFGGELSVLSVEFKEGNRFYKTDTQDPIINLTKKHHNHIHIFYTFYT